jgi:hypothetical protein
LQDFFKKNGVGVMTLRELFDFIVDASIADDDVDSYLEKVFVISLPLFTFSEKLEIYFCCLQKFAGATKNSGQRRYICRG